MRVVQRTHNLGTWSADPGSWVRRCLLQFQVPLCAFGTRPVMAIKTPTTQRAWRVLQVHHKDGPVRDASSKGGVEGAYLGPPLPAGRAPMGRASHRAPQGAARSAPESPGEASASSTMPTSSSHRSQHPSLAHLVASLGHGGVKIVIENGDASIEEQRKRVASYEMRARPFSGLPGGFGEAPDAGAI